MANIIKLYYCIFKHIAIAIIKCIYYMQLWMLAAIRQQPQHFRPTDFGPTATYTMVYQHDEQSTAHSKQHYMRRWKWWKCQVAEFSHQIAWTNTIIIIIISNWQFMTKVDKIMNNKKKYNNTVHTYTFFEFMLLY